MGLYDVNHMNKQSHEQSERCTDVIFWGAFTSSSQYTKTTFLICFVFRTTGKKFKTFIFVWTKYLMIIFFYFFFFFLFESILSKQVSFISYHTHTAFMYVTYVCIKIFRAVFHIDIFYHSNTYEQHWCAHIYTLILIRIHTQTKQTHQIHCINAYICVVQ